MKLLLRFLSSNERCLSHPRLFRLPYVSLFSCSCYPGSDTSAILWKEPTVVQMAIWELPGKSQLLHPSARHPRFCVLSSPCYSDITTSAICPLLTFLRNLVTTHQRSRKLDQTKQPEFNYVPHPSSLVSPSSPYGTGISRVPYPYDTLRSASHYGNPFTRIFVQRISYFCDLH